jgi:hypothetical protein
MLIEKAFTKLHGNYKSIAWGSMFESGNIFLGTGGKRIYTSTISLKGVKMIWTENTHRAETTLNQPEDNLVRITTKIKFILI